MHIAIITPEPVTFHGLQTFLDALQTSVEATCFGSLGGAIAAQNTGSFDLFLADTAADDYAENIAALCGAVAAKPVVLLSGTENPLTIRRAMQAGAKGCISRRASLAEIFAGLDYVLAGGAVIPANALGLENVLAADRFRGRLTPRQAEILGFIADGLSNKEIARLLTLSEGTVKLHVTAVLRCFGVRNRTDAARIAHERGGVDWRAPAAA